MRKKSFIVVLLVLLMSVVAFACAGGSKYKLDDYTDFSGEDNSVKLEIDEDMKLDGVIDEEAWANTNNKMSVTSSQTHSGAEDKPLKMDVYTHFGEKAVYFAFDVTDNTIFVNPSRRQSRNTGIELYMSALDNFTFGKGCISIRVTPMENGTAPIIGYYVPAGSKDWFQSKVAGKYAAATMVDGQYNVRNGANGYVVELAVSYDLIGGKTSAVQYTAAFVQALSIDQEGRLDNTFLKGTGYVSPGSWIGVTENSILAGDDKYDYLDANFVTPDADVKVDGKLDDAKWQEVINEGKGKKITHTGTGVSLTTYTLFGENGVYIGLDSDDPEVWYNADRQTKYNTGAEVFVSALGATELTSDTAVQIRFSVGGGSLRYRANPNSEYPYTQTYFPAKIAGSIKGNGEFNKSVDTENGYDGVDGWQGEIFIPWSAFGATTLEQKSQIAVFNCIYWSRSDAETPSGSEWKYLAPAGGEVYGNGSGDVNPQKSFFRFTKEDGFVFGGVEVPDVVFFKGNDGSYKATVKPRYVDAVTNSAFVTDTKLAVGGTFSVTGISNDSFTDNGDGTYTMTVTETEALKFVDGKEAHFALGEDVDAYFTITYIDVDSSKFDVSKLVAYLNFDGNAKTTAGSADASVTRGTADLVKYGTGSAVNGYYAANMKKSSVKLDATVGTGSFVMSAMVNGADVKNYYYNDERGGYAFVLFGTGNVDGFDGANGFSVRMRRDTLQIKFLDQLIKHDAALANVSDGWQRWTFVVDRETADQLTYTLYLDAEVIATKTIALASNVSLDVSGYNTIGIGAPGCGLDGNVPGDGYTDKSIGVDEFIYATGNYSFADMLDMTAWVNEAHAKYAFATDDVTFDFNDVTEGGYTRQIRVTAYPEDGTVIDVTDVTFGAEIAPYITKAGEGNYFTLTIPADKVIDFKDGVTTTYTYNGVAKRFTVKYVALEELYLDATEVTAWKKDKTGDNYVFTVGVYGDAAHAAMVTDVTFGDWNEYATDNNDGTYTFTVPATVVEALTSIKTVVVDKAGVNSSGFAFEYKYLTAEEIAALAKDTKAYIDFDGSVTDEIGGKASVERGEAAYGNGTKYEGDKYFAANQKTTSVKLATTLGTDSFTVSMLVNGADVRKYATDDYINGVPGARAGYAFVLFGTGNVDGNAGFTVRVRKDTVQVKVGGTNQDKPYTENTVLAAITDKWQRWTVTFDRSTEGTLKYTIYIDNTKVAERSVEYTGSLDVSGYNTLGIGAPGCGLDGTGGGYTDKSIGIDDFTLVNRVLTEKEIEALDSYYSDVLKIAGWRVDNHTFNFTDVTEGEAYTGEINFTTNGSGATITGATFTGLPEGVAIAEAAGVYTLTVPYEKLGSLKDGVTVTATIGEIARTFTIKYVPLEKVYLNKTSVSMWKGEKTDGNYKFNIGVYADSECTIGLSGVTFDKWNDYATYTANGVYAFSVPAATIEALTAAETITASKDTAETAAFTFEYKYFTAEEIAAIANKTEAYYDFNGNITDKISGTKTAAVVGEAIYSDHNGENTALKVTCKTNTVGAAIALGTESFTMSFDSKIYSEYFNGNAGYELVTSTIGDKDSNPGTFQFSVHGGNQVLRIQVGDNAGANHYYNDTKGKIKLDAWQRFTLVVERGLANDDETLETVRMTLYIDGVKVQTKTRSMAKGQVLGNGTVYFGGNFDWSTKTSEIDNFTFVRKALSDREVAGLDGYYGEIAALVGWSVDNHTFNFTDVTEGEAYTGEINFTTNGSGATITGATFTGLPEGVAITETAGVYTLNVPYEKVDDFKAGVTVTAKIGEVERTFTIKYVPLEKIYLDTTSVSMWKSEKVNGNYNFNIGVYADEEKTFGLSGVTFDKWNDYATYTANGVYAFSVPAATIEALTAAETITASKDTAETATFTFEYKYLTAEEIASLAKDTKAYIDFDGSVTDEIGGKASVERGEAAYGNGTKYEGDKYFAANQKTTSVKLATTLGTDSFTVSMLVNGADIKNYASSGYAFVLFGTGNVDGNAGFTVRVRKDTVQVKVGGTNQDKPYTENTVLAAITDKWQRWTVTFDRSTEGTLKYTIYIDNTKVAERSVEYTGSLDVSGYNTLGIGAPGCGLDSGTYAPNTIGIDDFTLVNRVLTEKEIAALDSYYSEISAIAGWGVDDVTITFDEVTAGEDKTVNLNIVKYATGAVTTGATFTGLPEGVTITETAGAYTLTVPYEKLGDLKTGVTVTAKIGEIARTFTIKYVPLDTLYASAVNFYEYEIDNGAAVTKTVKVSADAEGTVGIAGATFDNLPDGVTAAAGSTAGEYVLTVPAGKINELVASSATVSYDGVTTSVTSAYSAAILKDTAVYANIDTVSTKSSNTQGGQVFAGIDLGTDSFTVAFMADNLNKIGTGGGGYILFSTGNTDVSKGINVYANADKFRFRCAGVSGNFPIAHNLAQYTDWTHLAFTFDRSVAGKLTITAYVNYNKVGATTQTLTSEETFTYGESKKFVVGSINGDMWAESGAMTSTSQYNLSAAGVTIYRGVAPIGAVEKYFGRYLGDMTIPADAVQAKFTFADGTTANSVSGSGVTMTKNESAAETVVEGKDGGEDKAVQINSKSAYYDVNGFDVSTGSFAVSMDLKMDFVNAGTSETYELTANGSGIILFATTDPDATSGLAVSIRKNTIRVKVNGEYKTVTIDTDNNLNKWTNIAVIFTRGNGKCVANVYVNNAYKGNAAFTVADNVSLAGTTAGYIGIGSGTVYKWATDVTHTIDNVTLKM